MMNTTILSATKNSSSTVKPMFILGALFFIFGFVTWLNGTLIQYLKIACELNNFQSFMVTFAFYISYFFMALPSSWILQKTGYRKGMMIGLGVMAIGALVFIPAAETRTFSMFLTGLFIIGTGLSLLQTASNPYVTIVGPLDSAARRISIMGICNKVAGTLAPLILGAIVLSDADSLVDRLKAMDPVAKVAELDLLAARVILPYTLMAVTLFALSLFVLFSGLPEIEREPEVDSTGASPSTKTSVFQFPQLVLGVIALFLYVGAEVIAGDSIGLYGQKQGIALSIAKNFTAYTLTAMVVGYIIGILFIPKYLRQDKALAISAVVGLVFTLLTMVTSGYVSVLFIALLGLANALMWPAIWPLAIEGLGKFTKTASALLIMGIAGGATLPLLYGALSDVSSIGSQNAYAILFPCYAFILWYALAGHRRR